MHIRKLNTDDLDALLKLYTHLHTEEAAAIKLATATWESICETPNLHYFGVFDDELISSCNVCIIPNLTRGCRPYALIENVVTHMDHRRKGCGRAVIEAALAEAKANNCYKVLLMTGRKDEAVYRFYESVDFDRDAKQGFTIRLT